jgi:hypothetical protein
VAAHPARNAAVAATHAAGASFLPRIRPRSPAGTIESVYASPGKERPRRGGGHAAAGEGPGAHARCGRSVESDARGRVRGRVGLPSGSSRCGHPAEAGAAAFRWGASVPRRGGRSARCPCSSGLQGGSIHSLTAHALGARPHRVGCRDARGSESARIAWSCVSSARGLRRPAPAAVRRAGPSRSVPAARRPILGAGRAAGGSSGAPRPGRWLRSSPSRCRSSGTGSTFRCGR